MTRKEARLKAKEFNRNNWPRCVAEIVEDLIQKDYYVQTFDPNGKRSILS